LEPQTANSAKEVFCQENNSCQIDSVPTRKSQKRTRKTPKSPLAKKLTGHCNLLQWNELDSSLARARVDEIARKIISHMTERTPEMDNWILQFGANQYLIGFMEGLTGHHRALETRERLETQSISNLIRQVRESGTVEHFLARHGDEVIPTFLVNEANWNWLEKLRVGKPKATWNDAARKVVAKNTPKTRKAFLDQFRRLQEHAIEDTLARELLDKTASLLQTRKAKTAARNRKQSMKVTHP
jgi:hypothetical protein